MKKEVCWYDENSNKEIFFLINDVNEINLAMLMADKVYDDDGVSRIIINSNNKNKEIFNNLSKNKLLLTVYDNMIDFKSDEFIKYDAQFV